MGETPAGVERPVPVTSQVATSKSTSFSKNRHYSARKGSSATAAIGIGMSTPPISAPPTPTLPITPFSPANPSTVPAAPKEPVPDENLTSDLTTYLEERYGRNLPLFNAPLAKQALKRRIAGGLLPSDEDFGKIEDMARGAASGSGRKAISEDDVYLYPGGMSAIWHAFDICRVARRATGEEEGKSVCYG